MAGRLLLPVTLLITLLGAAYLYTDDFLTLSGAPGFVQNAWLAMSDLVLLWPFTPSISPTAAMARAMPSPNCWRR